MNWAKPLAIDKSGNAMQEYPAPFKAIPSIYYRDNLPVSSVVSLDGNTSAIEVGAFGGQGAVIRWIGTGETPGNFYTSVISSGLSANFDHWVPPSQVRRFVVPKETQGQPTGQIGSIHGLYQRVAVSNAGATSTSILLSQY
jgi:hypothetical protein